MSATGLAAVTLIESPGQLAAQSAAPATSLITATARWQVLRHGIVLPGVVRAARTISVTASAPYGTIVVTAMPVKLGDRVRPGQVIAEIDGRPILALRGRLPAFRNLHEGDTGPDVTQLQVALEQLGYADFDPPGLFAQSTALALLLLYRHLGYQAPLYHRPVTPSGRPLRRGRTTAGSPIPDAYLPMSEVSYLPTPAALVVAVNARTGAVVTAGRTVLRLATGSPQVAGVLSVHQAMLARAGIPARIVSVSPPLAAAGRLTRIGSILITGGQGGTGVTGYPVLVTSTRPLPQRLVGTRVRLTLWVAVTSGPVLTVPVAAVFAARAHPPYVVKIGSAGRRIRVAVFTGPIADGLVAVQPVAAGTLRPDDRVLIGIGR